MGLQHTSAAISLLLLLITPTILDAAKKSSNRQHVIDISDIKEFKKVLRTRTNVLVLYVKKDNSAQDIIDDYSKVAAEMKGLGTLIYVNCGEAKKMCKKLKISPNTMEIKHYKDGEFHKDYDRAPVYKSLLNFMQDPAGDLPWDEEANSKDVLHLDSDKALSKLLVKEKKPILLMFYTPWCGHCKRLKPEFAEAATELKSQVVLAGMDVDRPENHGSRQKFNVTGFPTIIYFENGEPKMPYSGERDKAGIINWLKDPQAVQEKPKEESWADEESEVVHLTDDTFDQFLKSNPSVMVMFYAPWCGHCKKMKPEYTVAAAELKASESEGRLAAVDATKHPKAAAQFGVRGYPTVKYFRDGELAWDFNERTADKILQHMLDPQEPPPPPPPEPAWSEQETLVQHLTEDNFKASLKKKKHALVMFYAPWCGHCKKAKPEFTGAAEHFKDSGKVMLAAIDCTQETGVCSEFEVKGYPTFKYFNYGKGPQAYEGGREEADFIRFLTNPANPASPPPQQKDQFWEDLIGGDKVHQLADTTFNDFISSNPSVLVMFYAPWCGHCKQMKPAYADAALKLEEQKIPGVLAAMDATVEKMIPAQYEVRGFPTLKYFRNGQLALEYSSGRDVNSLVNFMKESMPSSSANEEAQWDDTSSVVAHLTSDTFSQYVEEHEHVLVMFHTPTCAQCKASKPAFQEAANRMKADINRKYAAVDCTSEIDLCSSEDIRGYPTFNLFTSGHFNQEYNMGGRSANDFVSFMKNLASVHEEL